MLEKEDMDRHGMAFIGVDGDDWESGTSVQVSHGIRRSIFFSGDQTGISFIHLIIWFQKLSKKR